MKSLHALLFAVLLALSAWVVSRHRAPAAARAELAAPQHAPRFELSELVLPGAALVASLDLTALRRNIWGRAALEQLLPSEAQTEACTRSALSGVERLALTIPAERSAAAARDFAIVAEGNLQATAVLDCAARVMSAGGGQPSLSRLGTFQILRDTKGIGELAVRTGGPLILSGGSYFDALVERADGATRPLSGPREQLHAALRRELAPAPLLVTWVLPAGWLERWLEDPEVKSSPLADVRALSLRGELGDMLSLRALIAAENAESAGRIETFLLAARADFRDLIDATLGPRGSEQIRVVQSGLRVELSLQLGTRGLAARWLSDSPAPAAPSSHPVGSAHAQELEPKGERAPRRAAHDQP